VTVLRAVSADARLFDGPHRPATVAYVSRSAVNLSMLGNSWLLICEAGLGDGPHTVLVETDGRLGETMAVGDTVTVSRSGICDPAGDIVTWERAHRWVPDSPFGIGDGLGGRVTHAEEIAGALGCFLARPLISRPVRTLREACRELSALKLEIALADLVGLGPGLTPAGDDYIAGYCAALLHIGATNPRARKARTLVAEVIGGAPAQTPSMSEFLLGQNMAGVIPEFLSTCLRRLLQPSTRHLLAASVRRVLSHGATSGTEMMLGILDTCRDFCP
jgi:Protein of unknown function (DUF2877)